MEPFVGQITLFPFNFAPIGWALCEGQLLPISQYTAVFSLLGTYYGGNGTSNFALPDLRGRVPVGQGNGPGLSSYVIGSQQGVEMVALSSSQSPPHSHAFPTFAVAAADQRADERGIARRRPWHGAWRSGGQHLCPVADGNTHHARGGASWSRRRGINPTTTFSRT